MFNALKRAIVAAGVSSVLCLGPGTASAESILTGDLPRRENQRPGQRDGAKTLGLRGIPEFERHVGEHGERRA